jgi:IS5 family transposase
VRRIHQIPKILWFIVFYSLQIYLRKKDNYSFIVDSFPVKAYENHKSYHARIFAEKEYHGYSASRKQYFFGIKVHMIVDSDGIPIEFMLTPGNCSDVIGFKNMDLELPRGSFIFGDKAYNNYDFEDALQKERGITLVPKRKSNQKRSNKKELEQMLREKRNKIETVFSSITSRMPRYIKTRTETGFCLKIIFLILAYMMNLYHPFV